MRPLYNIAIRIYGLGIWSASHFNDKARKWVKGRKGLFKKMEQVLASSKPSTKRIWFHCASLGEFEQGRPVIEQFRNEHPDYEIILTFFSPSGYEIRKNYEGVDHIFYLPLDTRKNADRFVGIINPDIVVFIKYEYWFNYFRALHERGIPVIMISAIFRRDQYFFKPYGRWIREQLKTVRYFFVQDQASAGLLHSVGLTNTEVSGDTRFDRVRSIAEGASANPVVSSFCGGAAVVPGDENAVPAGDKNVVTPGDENAVASSGKNVVILGGSTWPEDEDLLLGLSGKLPPQVKFIIAPHEIHESRIQALEKKIGEHRTLRYSQAASGGPGMAGNTDARFLIIDGMGFLSGLYRYATLAYIGGGFGAGIHNILEAATFGKPVIFGPECKRFREAVDLVDSGGAFSIGKQEELNDVAGE